MRRWMGLLLTGLAAVVPVVGTIWLLVLIYKILLSVGDHMIGLSLKALNLLRSGEDLTSEHFAFYGSNFVRFLIPVMLLFLIGFAVANTPGRRVLHWMNSAMERIPYLGFIYSALKQFVDALRNLGGDRKFKSAAYVEYPSPGCRMLGFVTGNYHDAQTGKDVTTVFLPTSPNPMTGFIVIIDDDKVQDSEMTLEEASKMILSAGLVAPASFNQEIK
ncbi:DUF502 domain-containing protein [Verrucomicrobiaceae bacterium R5-34]|uniref:DUF502 domain-containing protein n=1 Tax=Oceaniferula flava TaxID=2800421 RepID=A0AAE2VEP0_9BACT|nr:DUF502 domain-containing protein [Oceaniferula flavus]MBK1831754.1 DUF502 domain-containing protein [Verrucomicrobiaceae bacterium R5-34]MBK1856079.1 DUF502 domain-containing protein [Oceaniferula flavus]MBM1137386.1 DUF502 domain-containing protein [Oceaniferula flavus]